jgi:hypothetical protein
MAGTKARAREGVATAMPAVEQMGQAWESIVEEFRSTQQCNCDARKMPARRRAKKQTHRVLPGILPGFALCVRR